MAGPWISQWTTFVGSPTGPELFPVVATSALGVSTNYNITFSNLATAFLGAFPAATANTVFAGPATGPSATPTFRALAIADIPWALLTSDIKATANATVTVVAIQNRAISSAAPNATSFLGYNGTTWLPEGIPWVTLSQDLSVTANGTATVIGIQTHTVLNTAPQTSFIFQYNGTSWFPTGAPVIATSLVVAANAIAVNAGVAVGTSTDPGAGNFLVQSNATIGTSLVIGSNLTVGANATVAVNLIVGANATIGTALVVGANALSVLTGVAVGTSSDPGPGNLFASNYINSGGFARVNASFGVNNSTTLVNIPSLTTQLLAGKSYIFNVVLFGSQNLCGIKTAVAAAGGATNIIFFGQAFGTTNLATANLFTTAATGLFVGIASAGPQPVFYYSGLITATNSGLFSLQLAQFTATTVATAFVQSGSWMQVFAVN